MNYMAELNAFYNLLRTSPLSTQAIALWGLMMNMANRTNWPPKLICSEGSLAGTLLISHGAFVKARAELVELGLIEYHKRTGNLAPSYVLKSLLPTVDKSGKYRGLKRIK